MALVEESDNGIGPTNATAGGTKTTGIRRLAAGLDSRRLEAAEESGSIRNPGASRRDGDGGCRAPSPAGAVVGDVEKEIVIFSALAAENSAVLDEGSQQPAARWSCCLDLPRDPLSYVLLVGLFYNLFVSVGIPFSLGVMYVEFLRSLGTTKAEASFVTSVCTGMLGCGGVFVGMSINKFGSSWSMVLGGLVSAAGLVLSMFVTSIYHLVLTLGFMVGLGNCFVNISCMSAIGERFDRCKTGITVAMTIARPLGTLVFPHIMSALLAEYGWRGSFLILGGVVLNTSATGLLLATADQRASDDEPPRKLFDVAILKSQRYLLVLLSMSVMQGCANNQVILIVDQSLSKGFDSAEGIFFLTCTSFGALSARFIFGFIELLLHAPHIVVFMSTGCVTGGCIILLSFLRKRTALLLTFLCFGISNGLRTCTLPVLCLDIFSIDKYASAFGISQTFVGLASIPTGPIAGHMTDILGDYHISNILTGATCAAVVVVVSPVILYFHFRKEKPELECTHL